MPFFLMFGITGHNHLHKYLNLRIIRAILLFGLSTMPFVLRLVGWLVYLFILRFCEFDANG